MTLFELSHQHRNWLTARQMAVAGNIANANTPEYKALAVADFKTTLSETRGDLSVTSGRHLTAERPMPEALPKDPDNQRVASHSGNSVDLEYELLQAGEINRAYALDASLTRLFNRMVAMGLR